MNVNSDDITKELAAARGQDESASLSDSLLSWQFIVDVFNT